MITFQENLYLKLDPILFAKQDPQPVINPKLLYLNTSLLEKFGLEKNDYSEQEWADLLSGNKFSKRTTPISLAYAGHQFGHFVPQLGDGRAVLLGCIQDKEKNTFDIQLKGSGQTHFSRRGDGRATLGSVLREYIISEAMYHMNIPTTRSMGIVTTGETVHRKVPLAGAVLTRIASSHIRIGTFEYLFYRKEYESLHTLVEHTIQRHYPHIQESQNPAIALLQEVQHSQAKLISQWMHICFIHGVMNTDNTSLSGETIDYGPCAFMDEYNPNTVFSSIDHQGRYSFQNQQHIIHWNITKLAETLLPLIHQNIPKAIEQTNEVLQKFQPIFKDEWLKIMCQKIGIFKYDKEENENQTLIHELLNIMHYFHADYTNTFRNLSHALVEKPNTTDIELCFKKERFQEWILQWKFRLSKQEQTYQESIHLMHCTNPVYIPRNHLVEHVIQSATMNNDLSAFHRLLEAITNPFEVNNSFKEYTKPPEDHERVLQTFCGT